MKPDVLHPKNIGVAISVCCGVKINSAAGHVWCPKCNVFCEYEIQPAYYEVSKGTWRKADYTKQADIKV